MVARSWTDRSRMNLFREIEVNVDSERWTFDIQIPSSRYFFTFIKSLTIVFLDNDHADRGGITLHVLTMFSECPLESIEIEGGRFFLDKRSAIGAHFNLLSGRLLKIQFCLCLFDPEPLRDILSIKDLKADITFECCEQVHPDDPTREDVSWEPVYHPAPQMLCVTGGVYMSSDEKEFLVDLSKLSVKFPRLEVCFYQTGQLDDTTQRLIDANAEVMSFLKLRATPKFICTLLINFALQIINPQLGTEVDTEVLPLPILFRCANLEELVLSMEGLNYFIITTPGDIIATLLEANCPNLFKITLEVEHSGEMFSDEAIEDDLEYWEYLDHVLTMLAEKLRDTQGRKLIFIMKMRGWEGPRVSMARNLLLRLLPFFYDEGLLHVYDGEDDVCNGNYPNAGDESVCVGLAALIEEYGNEWDCGGKKPVMSGPEEMNSTHGS